MNIDRSAFCNLANSNYWHKWLAAYDGDLYKSFLERLTRSRGCGDNKAIMDEILGVILSRSEGEMALFLFLSDTFPFMLLDHNGVDRLVLNELRGYFGSGVLTVPHRHIIAGTNLEERVVEFCRDKLECLYFISGDIAFVEFLYFDDLSFRDDVPSKSWLLSKYKFSRRIVNG